MRQEDHGIREQLGTLRAIRDAQFHALAMNNPKALAEIRQGARSPHDPGYPEWVEQLEAASEGTP